MTTFRSILLVAILLVIPATAAPVVVRELDGSEIVGELRAISAEQLQLADSQPETPIEIRQVMAVEFSRKRSAGEALQSSVLVLADSSRLPFEQIEVDKQRALVRLPKRIAGKSASELILAASDIDAIRFGRDPQHAAEWRRLAASADSTDLVVVYRKQGEAIDAVECVVDLVGANTVRVLLDGEPLDVPRAKVYGVAFARLNKSETPAAKIVIEAAGGLFIAAEKISLAELKTLRVTTAGGQVFDLPIETIERIDLSAGRVRWLGDLKLLEQSWRPRFGFPDGLPAAARPPGLLFDRSFAGEPLQVVGAGSGKVSEFARGVAMRSGGEAVFALPDGFQWFYATAGIDPRTLVEGAVVLRVYADDRLAGEYTIDGSAPVEVRTPLDDASRLRIVVDFGENLDLGDRLHLGDARVTR